MLTLLPALVGPPLTAWIALVASRVATRERARALGSSPRRRLPAGLRSSVERRLHDAAVELEPELAVQIWGGAAAVAGMLAFALEPGLAVPAVAFVAGAVPVGLRLARSRRARSLLAALPAALDTVAGELRAGGTVRSALASVSRERGPLGADVARVEARLGLGLSLDAALAHWVEERGTDAVRAVAGALAVADGVGGRAAVAIEGLARSLRDEQGAAAEARALSAQARLSAVVVGAAPLAYLVFDAVTDPASFGVLLGTPAGQGCLLIGLGFEVLAALWMRRIVGAVA